MGKAQTFSGQEHSEPFCCVTTPKSEHLLAPAWKKMDAARSPTSVGRRWARELRAPSQNLEAASGPGTNGKKSMMEQGQ
jgi:hypothetical protein